MAYAAPSTPSGSAKSKAKTSSKPGLMSMIVKLRLSPEALSGFSSDEADSKDFSRNTADGDVGSNTKRSESSSDNKSLNGGSSGGTPLGDDALSTVNGDDPSKKGTPGSKAGLKRSAPGSGSGADVSGSSKSKGKPGPKKKAKLEAESGPTTAAATTAAGHKLGPKANQGAINAGLRALDRTDKQPRQWHRKIFHLKSFTGVAWEAPLWKTPQAKGAFSKSDEPSEAAASSDAKPDNQNSGVGSETSNNVAEKTNGVAQVDMASSPSAPPQPPPLATPITA